LGVITPRRPIPAAAQPLTPAEDADYRALFGGDPVQVQASVRNIPALAAAEKATAALTDQQLMRQMFGQED
jgi:hypothetical protein